jgi:hypothetical protein
MDMDTIRTAITDRIRTMAIIGPIGTAGTAITATIVTTIITDTKVA